MSYLAGISYAYFTRDEIRRVLTGQACPVFINPYDPHYPFGNWMFSVCPGPTVGMRYEAGSPPVSQAALEQMKRDGEEIAAELALADPDDPNRAWDNPYWEHTDYPSGNEPDGGGGGGGNGTAPDIDLDPTPAPTAAEEMVGWLLSAVLGAALVSRLG